MRTNTFYINQLANSAESTKAPCTDFAHNQQKTSIHTSATQHDITESNKALPFVECWCIKKHNQNQECFNSQINLLLSLALRAKHVNRQILTIGARPPPKAPLKKPQNSMINMLYSHQNWSSKQKKKKNFIKTPITFTIPNDPKNQQNPENPNAMQS